jgi:hypothetical protein
VERDGFCFADLVPAAGAGPQTSRPGAVARAGADSDAT